MRYAPGANLYVNGLLPEWGEAEVQKIFSQYGTVVSLRIVRDADGSSKGYGFVAYSDTESAKVAIAGLNGASSGDNKTLTVKVKDAPAAASYTPDANLYVYGLQPAWSEEELKGIFSPYGTVVSVRIARGDDGNGKGYGFVAYSDAESAKVAIAHLDGAPAGDNKTLRVAVKDSSVKDGSGSVAARPSGLAIPGAALPSGSAIPLVPGAGVALPPGAAIPLVPNDVGIPLVASQSISLSSGLKAGKPLYAPEANLYIHGLPPEWTEAELREIFSPYGAIASLSIARDDGGNSKGYGFVAYIDYKCANMAMAAVNGAQVDANTKLTVRLTGTTNNAASTTPCSGQGLLRSNLEGLAEKQALVTSNFMGEARETFSKGGVRPAQAMLDAVQVPQPARSGAAAPGCTVYVAHMPSDWDEEEVKRHFQHCGPIVSASVLRDAAGESRRAAFVNFSNSRSVMKATFAMREFAAAPSCFLKVNPKRGEEHSVPGIPEVPGFVYPSPGNPTAGPTGELAKPGSTIFVTCMPQDWAEVEIYYHFNHLGQIVSIKEPSGGATLVGFREPLSAARAVKAMNGFMAGPKNYLEVAPKRGEEDFFAEILQFLQDVPDHLHHVRGNPIKVPDGANLYVAGFPLEWTEQDLHDQFSQFGSIISLKMGKNNGAPANYGYIGFKDIASAEAARSLDDFDYAGGKLVVKLRESFKAKDTVVWPELEGDPSALKRPRAENVDTHAAPDVSKAYRLSANAMLRGYNQ